MQSEMKLARSLCRFETILLAYLTFHNPVIQAPMAGGGDTPELVSAVSNAGALGFIGAAYLALEGIIKYGRAVRERTSRPFGINLFALLVSLSIDEAILAKAVERITPCFEELGLAAPTSPKLPALRFDEQLAGLQLYLWAFAAPGDSGH